MRLVEIPGNPGLVINYDQISHIREARMPVGTKERSTKVIITMLNKNEFDCLHETLESVAAFINNQLECVI